MSLITKLRDLEEIHFNDLDPEVIDEMLKDIDNTFIPPIYEESLHSFLTSSFIKYSSLASLYEMRAYAERDGVNRGYFIRMSGGYLGKLSEIMAKAEHLPLDFSPYRHENPDGTVTDTPLGQIKSMIVFKEEELKFLETQPRSKHYSYKGLMIEMYDAVGSENYEKAAQIREEIKNLTLKK